MDLYAYSQIESLEHVARENGIEIPRIRGYRLMGEEKPLSQEEVRDWLETSVNDAYETAVRLSPSFSTKTCVAEYSRRTDKLVKKYLIQEKETRIWYPEDHPEGKEYTITKTVGFRWELLHGKRRKNLKYIVKQALRENKEQIRLWNKYAGCEDVLYIHARDGSTSWSIKTWPEFKSEPWFLDACDDGTDSSYCDIYARISPVERGGE